jgi:hypothetical protein
MKKCEAASGDEELKRVNQGCTQQHPGKSVLENRFVGCYN